MHVKLSAALVKNLRFERRPKSPPVFLGDDLLETEETPSNVRDWVVRDTEVKGFGVRVTKGAKSYFVQRKMGASTSERWVLDVQTNFRAARARAVEWLAAMAQHVDPREELVKKTKERADAKVMKVNTFGAVYEKFVHEGVNLKPASVKDREKVVRWLSGTTLWTTPLHRVDTGEVQRLFKPLFEAADAAPARKSGQPRGNGPSSDLSTVWKCLRHCTTAWNLAEGSKVAQNPFSQWRKVHKRTLRVVEPREQMLDTKKDQGEAWVRELAKLRDHEEHRVAVVADYLTIVLLLGGRKTEVRVMRWNDIDWDNRRSSYDRTTTKARKKHYMPLGPWAIDILEQRRAKNAAAGFGVDSSDPLFPSSALFKGKHRPGEPIADYRTVALMLKETSGLWVRAHDLRRTLATDLFGDTLDVGTVERALGHGSKKPVTMGYIQQAVEALRPLYVARERRLRQLSGLDPGASPAAITLAQEGMLAAAAALLKQAGLTHEDMAAHMEQ